MGCGWLGLPLAEFLVDNKILVKGSVTRQEKLTILEEKNIKPFLLRLDPEISGDATDDFFDTDLLIINIPPGVKSQGEAFHVRQMEHLHSCIKNSRIKHCIYISSTSVYPDLNREVREEDVWSAEQAANKTLFLAEQVFRKDRDLNVLILRCAGLAGYDRNLVKHFAGKTNLQGGNTPVNLIHRDDLIQIIYSLFPHVIGNETLNVSAPVHPLRKILYPDLAKRYGFLQPEYDDIDHSSFKIINIQKLLEIIPYEFKFPDPASFYYYS